MVVVSRPLNLQHRRVGSTAAGDGAAPLAKFSRVLPQEILLMFWHPSLDKNVLGVLREKKKNQSPEIYAHLGLRTWSIV